MEFNKLCYISFNDFYTLLLVLYPELKDKYRYTSLVNFKNCFHRIITNWYTLIPSLLSEGYTNNDLVVDLDDFDIEAPHGHYYHVAYHTTFISYFVDCGLDYILLTGKPEVSLNDDYCYIDLFLNSKVGGCLFKEIYSSNRQKFGTLLYYLYSSYAYNKKKFIPFKFYKISTIYMVGKHIVRFVLECKVQND